MVIIMLNRPAGLWPAPRHEDRPEADHPHSDAAAGVVKA